MKHINKPLWLCSIILTFFLSTCSESVEPEITNPPYISLTIGDERQYFYTTDSSTIFYTVKEKLKRSDGYDIYSFEWYYGTDTTPSLHYYAIKDGFFIATERDTVRDSILHLPNNPFREQRLAKLYPKNDDIWQSIVGDSSSPFFVAKDIGIQITPVGIFNNTFSFTIGEFLSVNYSKGVGHISSIILADSIGFLSSYLKVGNKIYGTKIPSKDPIYPNMNFKDDHKKIFNHLLGIF